MFQFVISPMFKGYNLACNIGSAKLALHNLAKINSTKLDISIYDNGSKSYAVLIVEVNVLKMKKIILPFCNNLNHNFPI